MSFWSELKRRNVVKVAIAYLIVAWLILQVVSIIFPMFKMPAWTGTFMAVLLIVGFPLVLIFAWAFEITPEGLKRTHEVPHNESITHLTGQKLNYIVMGLLVIAVAYILFDNFYLDKLAIQTEVESRVAELAPPTVDEEETLKTIAVLPFEDLSPEKDQGYFVDGLIEELLNRLAQIPDLNVTGRTSSFSFKGSNKTVQEIAQVLGVENILEGSVRKAGNNLRITAQLLRGSDAFHLWSKTYDRKLEDVFAVQEDIATAVAEELKVTFGIDGSLRQMGGTDNVEAYEVYLVAQAVSHTPMDLNFAMETIDNAIALDPEFALAWVVKASIYSLFVINEPDKDRHASLLDAGLNASHRAIELVPNLWTGHASLGQYRTMKSEWTEAELSYRKAFELTNEPISVLVPQIPMHYMAVGYLTRAKELFEEIRQNDSLNSPNRGWYINCLGLLGDMQGAEGENEHCRAIFGDGFLTMGFFDFVIIGTRDVVSREDIIYCDPIFDAAKEHLDSQKDGLAEMRRLYNDEDNLSSGHFREISQWAAYFGDPEFAMEAIEKAHSLDATMILFLWYPKMREVRQLPRFKEFLREIGLVDYWEQFGWPDLCKPTGDGDFVCD